MHVLHTTACANPIVDGLATLQGGEECMLRTLLFALRQLVDSKLHLTHWLGGGAATPLVKTDGLRHDDRS